MIRQELIDAANEQWSKQLSTVVHFCDVYLEQCFSSLICNSEISANFISLTNLS